jgi:hypothetical protein
MALIVRLTIFKNFKEYIQINLIYLHKLYNCGLNQILSLKKLMILFKKII